MVQTLAALLSWIAMLALISIAVLVSGIWRPRERASVTTPRQPPLQSAGPARAQSQAIPQAIARNTARRRDKQQRRAV